MFPYHALDIYLPKLIRAGVRVAIVDDMSQAKDQKVSANAKEAQEPKDKEKKEEQKEQAKAETEKKAQGQKEPRGPQLVTVNGEKVSYAHAFQSNKNPETWYFTAKIDGKQLRPMMMHAGDLAAYQKREISVPTILPKWRRRSLLKSIRLTTSSPTEELSTR